MLFRSLSSHGSSRLPFTWGASLTSVSSPAGLFWLRSKSATPGAEAGGEIVPWSPWSGVSREIRRGDAPCGAPPVRPRRSNRIGAVRHGAGFRSSAAHSVRRDERAQALDVVRDLDDALLGAKHPRQGVIEEHSLDRKSVV